MILILIILPLLSSFFCGLFGSKIGYQGVKFFSLSLMVLNMIMSMLLINNIILNKSILEFTLLNWFNLGMLSSDFSLSIDSLSMSMLLLVNMVSFFVHLFSTSYMSNDPHLPSFMSYMSLFTFFMIVLVTSSNLIQLFIGWEGVGLCSYLLINFWFTSIQANKSAIKAMVINKIGDMGLLLGLIMLWLISGSLDFSSLFSYFSMPVVNQGFLFFSLILMMMGVMGKSAQMGLHMWLPDAMEGPTPVSALIHAATMVTAGVFLVMSLSPIFETLPSILLVVVFIGSLTSFFSSVMGLTQNDLKKVMAYSTCSQLGYMITICGFSCYNVSLFHLMNHGFFKALLFLSAGSMIHAFNDEQDFSKMGGVKIFLPLSYSLVLIGSLSLMGLPFLTGFYSKDLMMEIVYDSKISHYSLIFMMIAAMFTAFYSFSLMFYVFLNYPQSSKLSFSTIHEGELNLTIPLMVLGLFSVIFGYFFQFFIMNDYYPLMVLNLSKFSPLLVGLLGSSMLIFICLNMSKFWNMKANGIMNSLYNLSMYAFFFDYIISHYIVKPFMNVGYYFTYKLIDNQILELLGPTFFYGQISNYSNNLSKFHSGKISSYLFLFMLFMLLFMNL